MAQSIYEDYTFVTLAGPGNSGPNWLDGEGVMAGFNDPGGIARDANGNLYVVDAANNTIRKITPAGSVSTLAGLAGAAGSADGAGAAARFNSPFGIAVDGAGNVYVSDTGNQTIRKISPSGLVSTFAGLAGVSGAQDGTGSAARFNSPTGLAIDGNGNLFVADTLNDTIRKVTSSGQVTTFAGSAGKPGSVDKKKTSARFNFPIGIAFDNAGELYVADSRNDTIRKVTSAGVVSTLAGSAGSSGAADGTKGSARFANPDNLAVDNNGNIYVADTYNDTIRKITPQGVVTTLVGTAGISGSIDGTGTAARFLQPLGVAVDENTNLYVSDSGNNTIRKISAALVVTTFAGSAAASGTADGTGSSARFNLPIAAAFDNSGNAYVADEGNETIRKITPDGVVTTFAGTAGISGTNDGTGLTARFNNLAGLALDPDGNIFVADSYNHTIREVSPLAEVTTVAGLGGISGTNDGPGSSARFDVPFGIAIDANRALFVSDSFNQTIRKITSDGTVSTFAGAIQSSGTNNGLGSAAQFNFPQGVALAPNGNLYVLDEGNYTIRQVSPAGEVTTFAGVTGTAGSSDGPATAATFNLSFGLAADSQGDLYVADKDNDTIRKITPGGNVTTIGGVTGQAGNQDGTGSDARFNNPEGIAVDGQGIIYVLDSSNNSIRKGYPALSDVPTVDFAAARVGVTRHFSILNSTTTSWSWNIIRRPTASSAQLVGANTANPTFTPDVEDVYVVQFQGWDNSGHTTIRTLTLYADDTPPSIAITNPVAGQISSNGVFTVSGTASDNLGLSNVWIQLNGGAWMNPAGTTSWSSQLTLTKGTNVIRAYAEDLAGNVSQTNEVDLFYVVSAPLTVQIIGGGAVTPDLNGVLLEIGNTYSITAQAGSGCAFVGWTGSVTTNSPTLTFVMESNLTFTANFTDPVSPTVAISSPQNGLSVSNAVFTATGTAADNGQLASVWYQLNGGALIRATNTSSWAAGLALVPGANTLQVYSVDTFSNVSTTASVTFTYVPSSQITVAAAGQGTFSPNYNGWFLQIGQSYTMTAKPSFGYLFYSWVDAGGNTLATTPALTFQVQSNTTLQANFIPDPFAREAGPYAGLFYDTNNIAITNSGLVSLTLSDPGSFSTKLLFASTGKTVSFSGRFSTDGVFSNSIVVKGSSPIAVQLELDTTNDQVIGSVSSSGWTAQLAAVRAGFSPLNPAPEANKKYTLVIPGGDDSSVQPGGNGYGTISVTGAGNVSFSGVLSDGTKAAEKTFISKQGQWPFYAAPYKGQGAIFGWLTFTNEPDSDLSGLINWVRLPQATAKLYPAGFDFSNGIQAIGSQYSFTNKTPLLNLPSGGNVILQQGGLAQSFTNDFTLGTDNKVSGANGLSVTITTKSGLF
jgi:uncharacterized repeat protein (TIGR02543 family)